MKLLCSLFLIMGCFFSQLKAEVLYEGTNTFRSYGKVDFNWLIQFMPFNPVIIQAGTACNSEALHAAKFWPQHDLIVAFEPDSERFQELEDAIADNNLHRVKTYPFSVYPISDEKISSIKLDEWCAQNQIKHIDILRLELEGAELEALQNASEILKQTHIVIVQSFFQPHRKDLTWYFSLKDFLTKASFVPLAHWYEQGNRGLAVYVSQEMFDAYFIKCLGLGLGGISYP